MKIKPIHWGLIITTAFFAIGLFFAKNWIVYQIIMRTGHIDHFSVTITNSLVDMLKEVRKLEYVKKAWIKSSSIIFEGERLSGQITRLDSTNYGVTITIAPSEQAREAVRQDIEALIEKSKHYHRIIVFTLSPPPTAQSDA